MNCPNCGAPLREHAAFCTNCGSQVGEKKASKLKSTMPMNDAPVQQAAPAAPQQAPAAPYQTPAAPAAAYAPKTPDPSVYDVVNHAAPKTKPPKKSRKVNFGPVLHKLRAYLAVVFALCCIALLFLPWFNAAISVEGDAKIAGDPYSFVFGAEDVEDEDEQEELSILDVVQMEDIEDIVSLKLDEDEYGDFKYALEENGIKKGDYISKMLVGVDKDGKAKDISKVSVLGMKLPVGVVAMAPQLLCILLMVIFFIIGVIRVFASEPFLDGAPKTGWLKAGGIVGVVMAVITGAEVFAVNHFYQKLVDKFQSDEFTADIELFLGLKLWFILFAVAAVLVVLLATHWGRKKMAEAAETF